MSPRTYLSGVLICSGFFYPVPGKFDLTSNFTIHPKTDTDRTNLRTRMRHPVVFVVLLSSIAVNSLLGPSPSHHRHRHGAYAGRERQRTARVCLMDAAAREASGELEVADVDSFCLEGEVEGACLVRYDEEEDLAGTLLAAVVRCNTYDAADYVPVRVGDEQVGWANGALLAALAAQIELGRTCALEAREDLALPIVTLVGGLICSTTTDCDQEPIVPTVGLQLAPGATSVAETTKLVASICICMHAVSV